MGLIQQQSIRSTIYTYTGVLLGFVTVALLFPKFLTAEQIGVISLIVAWAMILAQIGTLGFNAAIIRYFPYFRDKEKGHMGFSVILMATGLIGFLLSLIIFFIVKPYVVSWNETSSPLFIENIYYIIPLTFFQLYFLLLDSYSNALYNTTTATFLKEFLQRILILFVLVLFILQMIGFESFVFFYCTTFYIITIILIIYLRQNGEFKLSTRFLASNKHLRKDIISISAFGFLTGFSNLAIMKIDVIMINEFFDSAESGIYATTFYFGTLIILPSRAINKIASTIIADAFKDDDKPTLKNIYYKSCLNQFILGSFLFLGIWLNIDNIFKIIPAEYAAGRYVIFYIGLSNLIKMTGGIDTALIGYSKYYKVNTIFIFLLLVFTVATNWFLIPRLGLTGAALASMISVLLFVLIKFVFIRSRFGLQPYNAKYIYLFFGFSIIYILVNLIPTVPYTFVDIFIRGTALTILFVPMIYFSKISPDINQILDVNFNRYFKR